LVALAESSLGGCAAPIEPLLPGRRTSSLGAAPLSDSAGLLARLPSASFWSASRARGRLFRHKHFKLSWYRNLCEF